MAKIEFREQGNTSAQHKGQLGKRPSLNTNVREWRTGRDGEEKGIT
jgi:hypothetical protein